MKKLLFLAFFVTLFTSCSLRDLLPEIEVTMPEITIQTPATQAGTGVLTQDVDVAEIDRLRGTANVSLTSLTFSAVLPESLTLDGFTAAKLVVSANGQSVVVFDSAISPQGRNYTASTSANITSLLDAARRGNGKIKFSMSVTKSTATVAATWRISTVAQIQ